MTTHVDLVAWSSRLLGASCTKLCAFVLRLEKLSVPGTGRVAPFVRVLRYACMRAQRCIQASSPYSDTHARPTPRCPAQKSADQYGIDPGTVCVVGPLS